MRSPIQLRTIRSLFCLKTNFEISVVQKYSFVCCFYSCEIWFLTQREGHGSRALEKKVARRLCRPYSEEVSNRMQKCTVRSFVICVPRQKYYEVNQIKKEEMDWIISTYRGDEIYEYICWEN
jgi:hypothetical protein